MAQDTDPGVGVGSPIPGGAVILDALLREACVSYQRSLEILNVDWKPGAYGMIGNQCEHVWTQYMREGWLDKLRMAGDEIKRDLGAPLCPMPIYDELHPLKSRIKLRQAPVDYLGRHTFTDWTEVNLSDGGDGTWYFDLCDSSIGAGTIDDIQFSYPDSVLECYDGLQYLQAPCINRITATCGGGEDGYRISWPDYQLIPPDTESVQSTFTGFLSEVKWREVSVDADLTFEIVGECNCGCCDDESALSLTLTDATEGIVCINNCDPQTVCTCNDMYIRINYGTAFSYGSSIAPSLEEAVVLLGLVKAWRTPIKPCGCDNTWIDGMLEIDPTANNAFAGQLTYGPTVAGMRVMRIMDKFLKKPHFNQEVMTGGLFSGNKTRRKRRRASYLRG
jgi:hypothetical protein